MHADISNCPSLGVCDLACMHGLDDDEEGCKVCECRSSPPCMDLLDCMEECRFGLVTVGGCELCECAPDPCEVSFPKYRCVFPDNTVALLPCCRLSSALTTTVARVA